MEGINSGTILNQRYEIIECIGIGGMAEVFKAQDLETGEYVALKILKREHSVESDFIKRFNNEAEAAAQLQHPNIVSIYGIGQEGDIHYIIMEYIEGVTLKDYIDAYQSVGWQDSLKTAAQVLLAMDHAHSKHIIHRDIKPLNIMIGNDGSVKLADFGIARALNAGTIHAGDSAGSVHYLSPEQARGGYVDERSDIYSLGITLFEMLVGVVPFDGESNVSVALKHIDGKFIPPHDIDPEIPIGVSDLVVIATRKDPGMRFQSARDMISKIRKVIENPHESLIETFTEDPAAVVAAVLSEADEEKKAESEAQKNINDAIAEESVENIGNDDAFDDTEDESEAPKSTGVKVRNTLLQILTYMTACVFAFFAIVWVMSCYNDSKAKIKDLFAPDVKIDIENYKGHFFSDVKQSLEESGLIVLDPVFEVNEEFPKGYIIAQSISSDVNLSVGDKIEFTVSAPENSYEMEDYKNTDISVTKSVLEDLGMNVTVKKIMTSDIKANHVVKTVPDVDEIITKGDNIVVYMSIGTMYNKVTVPDIAGSGKVTKDMAYDMLDALNLNYVRVYGPSEDITDIMAAIEATKDEIEERNNQYIKPSEPSESPEETDNPYNSPDESIENSETSTAEPTDSENLTTDDILPTESPEETISPSPDEDDYETVYSSYYVVGQFPLPGAEVYEGDTVYLYFIERSELMYLEGTEEITIPYPDDVVKKEDVDKLQIKIECIFETGEKYNYANPHLSSVKDDLTYEDFPVRAEIPFAYDTDYTIVNIYVNKAFYKKIYVYNS